MLTRRRQTTLIAVVVAFGVGTPIVGVPHVADASATVRPLTSYLIPATAIGSGFKRETYQDGGTLASETLAFCGKTFASESQRAARLQVGFYPIKGEQPQYSEEIVRYKPGKGAVARADLRRLAHLCPKKVTFDNADGGVTTSQVVVAHLAGTPKGALAITDYENFVGGSQPGGPYVTTDVYITRGDIMIALYRDSSGKPSTVAAMSRAAASRLNQ